MIKTKVYYQIWRLQNKEKNKFYQLSKKSNKIMNRQSHDIQIQSDNDEGFIPSKIIIKEKKEINLKKQSNKQEIRKQFIPRYITDGIMRKEPSQCYKRFSKFDFIEQSNNRNNHQYDMSNTFAQSSKDFQSIDGVQELSPQKYKNKQKLYTPYDKFVASGDFSLVYSRYKDFKFVKDQINFANHQVKLDCLRSLEQMKFKPIKPFQIIQEKSQEVITQVMNRTGSIKQTVLQFDSKFQCGNLLCAFKHKKQPYTYSLFIQNDTNTYGYNQWFYFSIKNAQTKIKYKFNIVNFRKRHSFFREGNLPVVFSLVDSKMRGKSGYSKRGQNLVYSKSSIVKSYNSKEKFFQLCFELQIYNQNDVTYISNGLPSSYSKLLNNLSLYQDMARSNGIKFQVQSAGTSIAGNSIPYVTITKGEGDRSEIQNLQGCSSYRQRENNFTQQIQQQSQQKRHIYTQSDPQIRKKKVILIIARQHPGQTWSSYLMDELIFGLVNQSIAESDYLLNNFIIKCIPMINVDGVISGNFRCDLTGIDLNRNWKVPSPLLHPQIYSIKNEIISLTNRGYIIETCFDLHGHSKQYNVFCYSCKTDNLECRLMPYIFYQLNQQFHFPFCTFGVSHYKQSTARAVIFSIIKNTNVLTIQSSFFGSKINGKLKIFQPETFLKMAETMLKGCKSYFSRDGHYTACRQIVKLRLSQFLQLKSQKDNALSGSDSQPSGDQMQMTQKIQKIIPKNLIQECIQMQNLKKSPKRVKKNIKRQTFQITSQKTNYQIKKLSFNSQGKNRTIDVVKEESPTKQAKSNWQKRKKLPDDEYNKTSHFKKKSIIMSNQTIDQSELLNNKRFFIKDIIDRQQHKLPFFSREKPQMIPMRLKNQSFEIFRDAYNATQKHIKHSNQTSLDDIRNPKKSVSKKLGIFKQKDKDPDQFPLLCVLSQNKKRTHVQKIKQRRQASNAEKDRDDGFPEKVKTAIQTRTEAIRQLRQKNKNSIYGVKILLDMGWHLALLRQVNDIPAQSIIKDFFKTTIHSF